jgi:hypothetical protein
MELMWSFDKEIKLELLPKFSGVPAQAWPESPGFGLALGGLGLRKL